MCVQLQRRYLLLCSALLGAGLLGTGSLLAQDRVFSEHEKLLKQGMDRLEHQIAPLRERVDVQLPRPAMVSTDALATEQSEQCFDVQAIHVAGVTLFDSKHIDQLIAPFLNQCLGLAKINAVIGVISNLYIEAGYVTSRAYIAPQDLSDGSLHIVVLEGVIENIDSAEGSISERQLRMAFPVAKGGRLNIRDLEQGIENLNSLGRNHAVVSLNPGDEQGGTVVVINNQLSRAWRGSVGLNNFGAASTGRYQLDANLVLDNAIGINDTSFFSVSSNVGKHELPHAESRSYALSWSVPVAYWHFSLFSNYYSYEQTVVGNVLDFSISGSSLNSGLQLSRNLYRSQSSKLDASASFTRKESKNYLEDVFLETSSRTLYVWDLAASFRHFLPQGTLSASAHVHKSVPWFGAKRALVAAEDDFQFTKYLLRLGFNSSTELVGQPLLYSASADFLYTPKVILASEGLTVGGRYSVRGLSQGNLFGYKGGFIRNDLSLPVQTDWPLLQQVHYFVGLDLGLSNLPEYPDKGTEWVAGSVAGIKVYDRNLSVTVSYARALRVPDFLQQKQQEIDFSVRFSF